MNRYFLLLSRYKTERVPYSVVNVIDFKQTKIQEEFDYIGGGNIVEYIYIDGRKNRESNSYGYPIAIKNHDEELTEEQYQCYKVLYG